MKLTSAALMSMVIIPAGAFAASQWDGAWKVRESSMKTTGNPHKYELSDGMWSCESCAPPYKIKADGTDQPVPDHAYLDTQAMKIVDASTIEETAKKAGKVTFWVSYTVSADGKTLTSKIKSYTGDKEVTGSLMETRLAAGTTGAHAVSGSWQPQAVSGTNDAFLIAKFKITAGGLRITVNGQTADAKFDSKAYSLSIDPGKTMVSFKKVDDKTIEETDRRLGKITDKIRYSLAADGKTISVVDDHPQHGTKTTFIFDKQ